jgi:hypothetical protein
MIRDNTAEPELKKTDKKIAAANDKSLYRIVKQ